MSTTTVMLDANVETAIRSLELALHPNTSDPEVMAAIRAWRRKFDGQSLELACRAKWDKRTSDGMGLVEYQEDWADRFRDKQSQINEMVGEMSRLREALVAAQYAQVAAQRDAKNLRAQLGKKAAIGGLPAIRDPDAPTVPIKAEPLYPVGQTELVYVAFGDLVLENVGWNASKHRIAAYLLAEGVAIDALRTCINGVLIGETAAKNHKFHEDTGLSIKNENPTEIFRGLYRAAEAFAQGRLKIAVVSLDKKPREGGKAGGKFSRGSAFPGMHVTIATRPPQPEMPDQAPADTEQPDLVPVEAVLAAVAPELLQPAAG